MTEQEAIKTIRAYYPSENNSDLREAFDIAIDYLKKSELLKRLEPRILKLDEIQEGGGYWMCAPRDFISRPVICIRKEMDAITFAWQFGTSSCCTEDYGTGWRGWWCLSTKPIP